MTRKKAVSLAGIRNRPVTFAGISAEPTEVWDAPEWKGRIISEADWRKVKPVLKALDAWWRTELTSKDVAKRVEDGLTKACLALDLHLEKRR